MAADTRQLDEMIVKGGRPEDVLSLCESYGKDFGERIAASAYRHRLFSLDFAARCSLSETERLCRLIRDGNVPCDLALYLVWQVLPSEMSGLRKGHFRALFQWLNRQCRDIGHPYRKTGWARGTKADAPLTKAGMTAAGLRTCLRSLDGEAFSRLLAFIGESVWKYRIFQTDVFEGLSHAQQAKVLERMNDAEKEGLVYFFDQLELCGFDPRELLCGIDDTDFTRLFKHSHTKRWDRLTDRPELFKALPETKRRIYLQQVENREYPMRALETVMLGKFGSGLSRLASDALGSDCVRSCLFRMDPSIGDLHALIRESAGFHELSIKCLLHGRTGDELFGKPGLISLLHLGRTDILKTMMDRERAKIAASYDITSFLEEIL